MNGVWCSDVPVFLHLLSDIDKSRKGSHLCNANANCINTSSSYTCFDSVHKNAKKRPRLISSHLDRISLANKAFITWQKDFASLRIKKHLLIWRDGIESQLFLQPNTPTRVFFIFDCLLPLFATPLLTLSITYELSCKFAPGNFLSCGGLNRAIPSGRNGPFYPLR